MSHISYPEGAGPTFRAIGSPTLIARDPFTGRIFQTRDPRDLNQKIKRKRKKIGRPAGATLEVQPDDIWTAPRFRRVIGERKHTYVTAVCDAHPYIGARTSEVAIAAVCRARKFYGRAFYICGATSRFPKTTPRTRPARHKQVECIDQDQAGFGVDGRERRVIAPRGATKRVFAVRVCFTIVQFLYE